MVFRPRSSPVHSLLLFTLVLLVSELLQSTVFRMSDLCRDRRCQMLSSEPCHAVPCRAVPYHKVPSCPVPYRTAPSRTVPYRTVPFTIPYRTVPSRPVPSHPIPYRTSTISYRAVPTLSCCFSHLFVGLFVCICLFVCGVCGATDSRIIHTGRDNRGSMLSAVVWIGRDQWQPQSDSRVLLPPPPGSSRASLSARHV